MNLQKNDIQQTISLQTQLLLPKQKSLARNSPPVVVAEPETYDVLCGKDKTYGKHPGNQVFRCSIESFVAAYQRADQKQAKMRITRQIVCLMKQNYNSRFLKLSKEEGQCKWIEISDELARDKVSHALRFAANNAGVSSSSSTASSSTSSTLSQHKRSRHVCSALRAANETDCKAMTENCTLDTFTNNLDVDLIFQRQQAILETMRQEQVESLNAANSLVRAAIYNNDRHTDDKLCFDSTEHGSFLQPLDCPSLSTNCASFSPQGTSELKILQSDEIDAMMREPLEVDADLAIISHLDF